MPLAFSVMELAVSVPVTLMVDVARTVTSPRAQADDTEPAIVTLDALIEREVVEAAAVTAPLIVTSPVTTTLHVLDAHVREPVAATRRLRVGTAYVEDDRTDDELTMHVPAVMASHGTKIALGVGVADGVCELDNVTVLDREVDTVIVGVGDAVAVGGDVAHETTPPCGVHTVP